MKEVLGIAVGQMNSVDDVEKNYQQIIELLSQVKKSDEIELVCFPENSLYMRIKEGEKIAGLAIDHPVFSKLSEEAKKRKLNFHLGSVAIKLKDKLANASVFISDQGQVTLSYKKIHLFDISIEGEVSVRESDIYTHGETPEILKLEGWNFGQTICYDMRFSELFSWYAQHHVEALLAPSSFLVPTGKLHWHILLQARAIESQAYVIAAAQAGTHQSTKTKAVRETYGHSLIIDPWGKILQEGPAEGAALLKAKLDLKRIKTVRKQMPMSDHRRLIKMNDKTQDKMKKK